MKPKFLLIAIAVVELLTGAGLLLAPSMVVELLLGQALGPGVPLVVARVAGAALIAIGLMCWIAKAPDLAGPTTGLLIGLLAYNAVVPLILIHGALANGIGGIALWPTVVLHLAFTAWIAACIRLQLAARGQSAA